MAGGYGRIAGVPEALLVDLPKLPASCHVVAMSMVDTYSRPPCRMIDALPGSVTKSRDGADSVRFLPHCPR